MGTVKFREGWLTALLTSVPLCRYLTMSLNSSQVRGQDVHSVLAAVASNPSGSLLAWRHLQRHWAAIWTTFHSGSFTMGAIIKSVVSHFSTQFDYDQVKIFIMEKNKVFLDIWFFSLSLSSKYRRPGNLQGKNPFLSFFYLSVRIGIQI